MTFCLHSEGVVLPLVAIPGIFGINTSHLSFSDDKNINWDDLRKFALFVCVQSKVC